MKTAAERRKAYIDRHSRIRERLRISLVDSDYKVNYYRRQDEYLKKVNSAYWLLSTLILWVKIPKDKSNMIAIENYVGRIMNEEEKEFRRLFT